MDRCLALEEWTTTGSYQALLDRDSGQPNEQRLVIDKVYIKGLPDSDSGFRTASDPIITVILGDKTFHSGIFSNNNNPSLKDLLWKTRFSPNMKIIIEVRDHDSASGNDFIGACCIPVRTMTSATKTTIDLRRDVKERSTETKLPEVTIEYHVETVRE